MKYTEEEEEGIYLKIRKVLHHDEQDPEERDQIEKVRRFLTHIEWRNDAEVIGGATWLELYIPSILHGGKIEADPMAKTVSLQTALKLFEQRVNN